MIVFVSGHLDVTPAEFAEHYEAKLDRLVPEGHQFVVGDARGADTLAQQFLKSRGASVTVFHMFTEARFNAGFPTSGGYQTDDERDAAMTHASDTDLAWVRPGREGSCTHKNLQRRLAK
jgi:hypothetical protein